MADILRDAEQAARQHRDEFPSHFRAVDGEIVAIWLAPVYSDGGIARYGDGLDSVYIEVETRSVATGRYREVDRWSTSIRLNAFKPSEFFVEKTGGAALAYSLREAPERGRVWEHCDAPAKAYSDLVIFPDGEIRPCVAAVTLRKRVQPGKKWTF